MIPLRSCRSSNLSSVLTSQKLLCNLHPEVLASAPKPSPKPCLPPTKSSAELPISLGFLPFNYQPLPSNYVSYLDKRDHLLLWSYGRAALMKGGIIACLACDFLSDHMDALMCGGPSEDMFKYGTATKIGAEYFGTMTWTWMTNKWYVVYTCTRSPPVSQSLPLWLHTDCSSGQQDISLGEQTADVSWWPKQSTWEACGLNVSYCYRNPRCLWVSYGLAKGDILSFLKLLALTPQTIDLVPWPDILFWIPWARYVQFHLPFYSSQCCLLFFLDIRLVLLGVLLCWFCSSTAELYPLANRWMSSFYIHWPISIHFPYMEVSSSWLVPFIVSFLLWTLPTPDWLLCHSVLQFRLPFRVHSILYIQCLSLYHLFS